MRSTKFADILAFAAILVTFLAFATNASPLPESTSIAIGGPNNVARKTKVCICTCETNTCKSHCCAASQEKSTLGALALRTFYGIEPFQAARQHEPTKGFSTSLATRNIDEVNTISSAPHPIKRLISAQKPAGHEVSTGQAVVEGKSVQRTSLKAASLDVGTVKAAIRSCCPCHEVGYECSELCCAGQKQAHAAIDDGASAMASHGEEVGQERGVMALARTHSGPALLAPRADDEKH